MREIAMMMTMGGIPVKTRVPLAAWAFAGLLTLLSIMSSLVHSAVDKPQAFSTLASIAHHAIVNR